MDHIQFQLHITAVYLLMWDICNLLLKFFFFHAKECNETMQNLFFTKSLHQSIRIFSGFSFFFQDKTVFAPRMTLKQVEVNPVSSLGVAP